MPIWPYDYHHGIEEWLYVLAGAPAIREPAGERILTSGDLVCFPSGHRGAHTVKGTGRFVIFATGQHVEPWMSVYPDSDKVSGPEGILLRRSAVGYWHGEGTSGPSETVQIRERNGSPPQPVVNVAAVDAEAAGPHAPAGLRHRAAMLGSLLGAERLDATLVELEPGQGLSSGRPSRCSPAAQSQRASRSRAVLVDDGPASQRLLPGHRAVADPERLRPGCGCGPRDRFIRGKRIQFGSSGVRSRLRPRVRRDRGMPCTRRRSPRPARRPRSRRRSRPVLPPSR